ncbi:hypothetical protein SBC1_53310 (plasmid) [Caballeronia sp. SBC1]|uniref:hypothetical protein n=1 Tax=unclassified Caballeronia TaxID=2646786 RepID=UPI0013E18F91|nr:MULTISPECIES: hypothetical protein [unclassified Caballeronia]QIE27235.1 hypothetical protein SBC2_53050 [Caballeronia sp. SBC2]QIN65286.1 hypothetical protein SBC1_53310 [Caballeronia sp. SBC1]
MNRADTPTPPANKNHSIAEIDGLLNDMFSAAIAVAQPTLRVPEFLPSRPKGRLIVR